VTSISLGLIDGSLLFFQWLLRRVYADIDNDSQLACCFRRASISMYRLKQGEQHVRCSLTSASRSSTGCSAMRCKSQSGGQPIR
jgi:hypothetical protein